MKQALRAVWAVGLLAACSPLRAAAAETVRLPGGEGGLRLDDYYYDKALGRLVVPAGRSGKVDLIDPKTRAVEPIEGFAAPTDSTGPAGGGPTSADGADGTIYVTDRSDKTLYVVDGRAKAILAKAALSERPDYVRFVAVTHEVWVTEPRKDRIEIFSLGVSSEAPKPAGMIRSEKGEFEALVVDAFRGRAYSNRGGRTVAIDLRSRKIAAEWDNGCEIGEGLALDEAEGFLMVACGEGRVTVLNVAQGGKRLSSFDSGKGIDIISYLPEKRLLAIPGSRSATLAFASLSQDGQLSLLATSEGVKGGHCVALDGSGAAWVCDGAKGALAVTPAPAR